MSVDFSPELVEAWPCLAWVAVCRPRAKIQVLHGRRVELHPNWFGEIVWDGKFDHGDFDQTDHAFGSGGRLRDGQMTFVSSASVVDRLHTHRVGDATLVSNSLAALLAVADIRVLPHFARYPALFRSICKGIKNYEREIPVHGGKIRLVYMSNLRWNGVELSPENKPMVQRPLNCFSDYRGQLRICLKNLGDNWQSPERRFPWKGLSTISTGYDSPTVSVLGRDAGLTDTLSITTGRGGDNDDGSRISRALGLTAHTAERDGWRKQPEAELPFLASDAKGEDVYFAGADSLLSGKVLLTGYGGTRVWGKKAELSLDFQRNDQSGLSHTEARLHHGYLHLPVPFLIARQVRDLRKITEGREMDPWRVSGDYDCPLARRIVEQAGIPREWFGMHKKAASVLLFDRGSFLSVESDRQFRRWYRHKVGGRRRAWDAARHQMERTASSLAAVGQAVAGKLSNHVRLEIANRIASSSRLAEFAAYEPRFRHLFPWAIEHVSDRYRLAYLASSRRIPAQAQRNETCSN